MKTKNEIITELDALLRKGGVEKTEFETLSSDINNLSAAEKEEVLLDFIKKVYSMEDLINFYNRHPEKLNDQISAAMNDFKDTTGYSDSEIKELFDKAGLTEENVKVEVEKALDLDLLEAKNAADQEGISLEEWLERDIERLETEKNEELAEIDRQIDELEKNLDHSNFEDLDITEITNQIEQLSQERVKIQEEKGNNLTSEDIAKIQELSQKLETLNTLKEQKENAKDENNENNEYVDKIEKIDEEIEQLNQERIAIQEAKVNNLTNEDIAKIQEINRKINDLNQEKESYREKIAEDEKNNTIDSELLNALLDEKVKELNDERVKGLEGKENNLTPEEIKKHQELSLTLNKYNEIKDNYNNNNVILDNENLLSKLISEKIEKLEKERSDLIASAGQNLTPEMITKHQELTNKIEKYKKLALLVEKKKIKDASKKEKENKKDKKDNSEEIKKLKEQRKKLAHKYDTLIAKRKKQLEKLKKEKENQNKNGKKKGNRKDLVYKTLAGGVGFVVGVGLSCEPGIGQVRMMISSAKLIQAGVNKGVKVWSKKHPEGKIAKISSKLSDKAQKFGENHPRIASAYNKTKKFIGNDKVQWFINGVAAGYVAGNIYEKLTGQTVSEALFSNNDTKDVTNVANVPTQPNTPSNTPDVPSNTPADINLTPGQSYDLSGLSQGLVSSDSHDYVNLLTEYGKDAVVDKFHTLPNGEIMVHFSSGGEGYAWLPLDEVKEYLAKGAEVVENVSRSL